MRVTEAVSDVLAAFLAAPETRRYGLDLMRASGHSSGTVYPILLRLRDAGWAEAVWEEPGPVAPRRRYRLTPEGMAAAGNAS